MLAPPFGSTAFKQVVGRGAVVALGGPQGEQQQGAEPEAPGEWAALHDNERL